MKAIKNQDNTITIGNLTIELTSEKKRRIVDAMIETQRKLDKEMAYSEDLRKHDICEEYRTHIENLKNLLA